MKRLIFALACLAFAAGCLTPLAKIPTDVSVQEDLRIKTEDKGEFLLPAGHYRMFFNHLLGCWYRSEEGKVFSVLPDSGRNASSGGLGYDRRCDRYFIWRYEIATPGTVGIAGVIIRSEGGEREMVFVGFLPNEYNPLIVAASAIATKEAPTPASSMPPPVQPSRQP